MTAGNPSHWRKKQEQSIWMKSVQFYICGDGKTKKRWIVVRDFCNFSCCPGVVRGRRIRGIRPEEKESRLLTLRCIFFFVIIRASFLFFWGGGGSFLLGRNFGVLSQIMKEGNFASATSIAAGVWLHTQNRGTLKMFSDYVHRTSLSYDFMV